MKLITTVAAARNGAGRRPRPGAHPAVRLGLHGTSESEATQEFAQRLRLDGRFGATVSIWNGCYKVQQFGSDGKFTTDYFDPDTKHRID